MARRLGAANGQEGRCEPVIRLYSIYARSIVMLWRERGLAIMLASASAAVGIIQLAEPVLFGAIVDALAKQRPAGWYILIWALIGLVAIGASVVVAVAADRLAHRQRLTAMAEAFDAAITLPVSYHARTGTGAVVRNILEGANALFATWLSLLREQCTSIVTIVLLVPLAFWMEWRLALLLTMLAVVYAVMNTVVVRRTSEGQRAVERHHVDVAGRVGDVVGNIAVVQSLCAASTRKLRACGRSCRISCVRSTRY